MAPTGWTYARSGVDRAAVHTALSALLRAAKYQPPASSGRPVESSGHYAGLWRLGRQTVALTTDTVGTKTLLARDVGSWEEVGEDLVAANVNDLAAVGARPAALVDVISCVRPDAESFAAIGRGIRRGLAASRCGLVGGETAVVPEIVSGTDLGATALGFFPSGRAPILGRSIRPGDRLVGLPSAGFHANGFTLIRRLVREAGLRLDRPRPGARRPLGRELLTPTRTYVRATEALAGFRTTTGLAHISGGGVRNLARLHPGVEFVLDGWPAPAGPFEWIAELGDLAPSELYQTFNMGIGYVVVTRADSVEATLRRLARAGAGDAREVGHVEPGRGVSLPTWGLDYRAYH